MRLKLNNISKNYGETEVLRHLTYEFSEGVYGLLGANGTGKSTLLNIISRVFPPETGEILLNGSRQAFEEYYANLGFLPQDFYYYSEFTGYEFLRYMSLLKGNKRNKTKQECEKLLDLVGLSKKKDKKISSYSGGMKQRLGIAQTLINNPKLLILDEPTVGLDPKERVRFRNLISSLSKDKIIILSTHIVSDIEYIADQILILKDGEFKEQGSPSELVATIQGKVWEVVLDSKETLILNQDYIIVNQKPTAQGQMVRLVSDKRPEFSGARNVEPVLEDLYLYYFGGELL